MRLQLFFSLACVTSFSLLACSSADDSRDSEPSEKTSEDLKMCVQNLLCVAGSHFDTTQCKCVANPCVQTQLCIASSHFDTTQCKCVPNACVQTLLCLSGYHWSQAECKCVPGCVG